MPGLKPKDHTNKRFGDCVAISYEGRQHFLTQSIALWKLRCDCGATFTAAIRDFIGKKRRDCGHVLAERRASSNRAYPLFSPEDKGIESIEWHLHPNGYAMTGGGNNKTYAHRLVLERKLGRKLKAGELADHINWDKNDNRRENLRVCSKGQNTINRPRRPDNTTGYVGVYYFSGNPQWNLKKRWTAKFTIMNKTTTIGYFKTKEEAATAYNAAAQKYYGEFAVLNKI